MGQSTAAVRHDIERTRAEMSETIDAIADRTSPSRIVDRQRRRASDRVRSMRNTVMGTAGSGRDAVTYRTGSMESTATDVVDTAREAPDMVMERAQGNPLAAGLIAFGGGLLVASILPSSRPERQATAALREQAEPAIEQMKQAGQELAEGVKSSAQEAGDQVKETAAESVRQVADEAKSSAQQVKQETVASGHEVPGQSGGPVYPPGRSTLT